MSRIRRITISCVSFQIQPDHDVTPPQPRCHGDVSQETAAEAVVEVLQALRSAPLQHFLNWEAYLFTAEAGHQSISILNGKGTTSNIHTAILFCQQVHMRLRGFGLIYLCCWLYLLVADCCSPCLGGVSMVMDESLFPGFVAAFPGALGKLLGRWICPAKPVKSKLIPRRFA